jgi:hypothetical protein
LFILGLGSIAEAEKALHTLKHGGMKKRARPPYDYDRMIDVRIRISSEASRMLA